MSIARSSMKTAHNVVFCRRNFSHGALPGGFSQEALQQWAMNEWGITAATTRRHHQHHQQKLNLPLVDLFSQKISTECVHYLNDHNAHGRHPSSELTRCYLSSTHFLPERAILTALFSIFGPSSSQSTSSSTLTSNEIDTKEVTTTITQLPTSFLVGTQYLGWTVAAESPLEIICTWQLSETIKGCTMIAYDPALQRVYNGNCLYPSSFISEEDVKTKRSNESLSNFLARSILIPLHVSYAKFLLSGMVKEVERKASDSKRK